MEEKKLLTTAQVGERLGVTADCIRKWDESGTLKHDLVTEGGHRRYTEETVREYTEKKNNDVNPEKVWEENGLIVKDQPILENESERLLKRMAFCPECGGELISDAPKMYNPFNFSSIAFCKCKKCGKNFRTEHAYPRLVIKDSDLKEMRLWV